MSWTSKEHASALKSFIDVTPKGKFNVIDMSVNGDGEWKKWNNASFWDANFVWTTLHDFGGTDGLKGKCKVCVGFVFWGTCKCVVGNLTLDLVVAHRLHRMVGAHQ